MLDPARREAAQRLAAAEVVVAAEAVLSEFVDDGLAVALVFVVVPPQAANLRAAAPTNSAKRVDVPRGLMSPMTPDTGRRFHAGLLDRSAVKPSARWRRSTWS